MADWDGDGKPDRFALHVAKQYDYATVSGQRSKEKFWWYHCWLKVASAETHKEIWRDEWFVKEDDVSSFRDMADFSADREYFEKWFTIPSNFEKGKVVNVFESLRLTTEDIDTDVLASEIGRLKIQGVTAKQIRGLITSNPKSGSFCYRATWREDLRCAVYVPRLQRALLYRNGYQ